MPFSPSFFCKRQKINSRNAKVVSRATTLAEFQGYSAPPHCRASSRQQTAAISVIAPKGSMFESFPRSDLLRSPTWARRLSRQTRIKKNATAPMGTLLSMLGIKPFVQKMSHLHPETPPPSHVTRQSTSQYRAKACCQPKCANNDSQIQWSLFERYRNCIYTECSLEQSSCA